MFKLDPDRTLSDEDLERICTSGTDAIIVGGSSGITYDKVHQLYLRIRRYPIFCALEVSEQSALVPGFDLYLIPVVMNTDQSEWIVGKHHAAIKAFGRWLPWHQVAVEGYVILNEHSTVAKRTSAKTHLTESDVEAYALLVDHLFRFPILYIEYSGRFGNMEWVKTLKKQMVHAQLFYGGGIDSVDKAEKAAHSAHTVVVGNAVYDRLDEALRTVEAVHKIKREIVD